jgi:hypothetical protein
MTHIPILAGALFGGAISFMVASALLFYALIGKVNRFLPENEQISYLFLYPGKISKIKREYKRFYPDSRLLLVRLVLNTLGFVLLLMCMIQLGFFR